jgi:cysteine desulfurase
VPNEFIYLDHAAATPLDERVLAAMQPYFSQKFFNPSSPYIPALSVRREYEAAKDEIAAIIGGKSDELVMTAGATESINIMMGSIKGHIVTTKIEHAAVLEAVKHRDAALVEVDEKGSLKLSSLRDAIRDDTELISVGLANNEIGTVQKLRDIAELIKLVRQNRRESGNKTPLYLHTDASQGVGQIDINVARLGVDALTMNAGKIYGPKQVGLLWVSREVKLAPFIHGGGQERGVRSGTENVAGVIGFAKALQLANEHRRSEVVRLTALRDSLEAALVTAFPEAVISGNPKHRLSGHLHLSFPGIDAERIVFALESQGVYVATGSACAANKGTRSHVLTHIGLAPEVADGSIRMTLGRLSDEKNIKTAAAIMIATVRAEYERSGQ